MEPEVRWDLRDLWPGWMDPESLGDLRGSMYPLASLLLLKLLLFQTAPAVPGQDGRGGDLTSALR